MEADVITRHAEARFRAMGSDAHVIVCGDEPESLVADAQRYIATLEQLWSRFIETSEISRLNAGAGRMVAVSAETFLLIQRAIDAWRATDGRYDPTVLTAVEAAGYHESFPFAPAKTETPARSPGCARIALVEDLRLVRLPAGVGIDPGGIGKGLAADLVVARLRARGAKGACVNLGGDVRVWGESPHGDAWVVDVEDPWDGSPIAQLSIADGALATSSRTRRHWETDDGARHHLIDPATGTSANTGVAAVTVVAGDAWWAEVLAKATFLAGPTNAGALLEGYDAAGLLVTDEGQQIPLGPIAGFMR